METLGEEVGHQGAATCLHFGVQCYCSFHLHVTVRELKQVFLVALKRILSTCIHFILP